MKRVRAVSLPPDPFWLLRVRVPNDGDCIPFHVWLIWHHQFFVPRLSGVLA